MAAIFALIMREATGLRRASHSSRGVLSVSPKRHDRFVRLVSKVGAYVRWRHRKPWARLCSVCAHERVRGIFVDERTERNRELKVDQGIGGVGCVEVHDGFWYRLGLSGAGLFRAMWELATCRP